MTNLQSKWLKKKEKVKITKIKNESGDIFTDSLEIKGLQESTWKNSMPNVLGCYDKMP